MAEVTVDEELVYVPDRLFCPKCLSVFIGAPAREGTLCSMDETPQKRLTWKQEAELLGRLRQSELERRQSTRDTIERLAREVGGTVNW